MDYHPPYKISGAALRVFVGGALASIGFQSLIWLPHDFIVLHDINQGVASFVICLGLPIGVALLGGSVRAGRLAMIYLWLCVLSASVELCFGIFGMLHLWRVGERLVWVGISALITPLTLICLLRWSRVKQFQELSEQGKQLDMKSKD